VSRESALAELIQHAERMAASVNFDDNGAIVGGQLVGGNGGLVSSDTRRAVDAFTRSLAVWKEFYAERKDEHASNVESP
jgi:hypothetical protein